MAPFVLVMALAGGAALAANDSVSIVLDGKPVQGDAPAVIRDGRTLVPVRFVAEALGLTVQWNGVTRQVTIEDGKGKNILLTVDQPGVVVDGTQSFLDVPASVLSGRTYVPLRFVGESLGLNVAWDPDTRTVTLMRKPQAAPDTRAKDNTPPTPEFKSSADVAGYVSVAILRMGGAEAKVSYAWDGASVIQTVPLGPMGEPVPRGMVESNGVRREYAFDPKKGFEFVNDGAAAGLLKAVEATHQRLARVLVFMPLALKYAGPADCAGGAQLDSVEAPRPADLPADAPSLVPYKGTGAVTVCPAEESLRIAVDGSETVNNEAVAFRSEILIQPAQKTAPPQEGVR